MKYQFYLPTYEECLAICQNNENFYEKKVVINGVEVSVFNYRLAQLKDFQNPIINSPVQAHELRGITFIPSKEGKKRFLMLHKFFNLNQVEGYQYHQIKDLSITRVQDKMDGSMIRFVEINGQVFAKTKNSFENDQVTMAQEIYNEDKNLQSFVQETLKEGLAAIFELVSYRNQIVLSYQKTKLSLLQLRKEDTGEYLDIYKHPLVLGYKIETTKEEELLSLDHYMEQAKVVENKEGWIFTLGNGQMIKLKGTWYCERHGLLTNDLVRENKIVELIVNEKLDDAFGMIGENDPRKTYAEAIQKAIIHYLSEQMQDLKSLVNKYQGDRKSYALANLKHPLFSLAVKLLEVKDFEEKAYGKLKEKLVKDTNRLMEAKDFISNTLKVELKNLEDRYDQEG